MSEALQYYEHERRLRRETGEVVEAHHRMPDGKLIATVQFCYHCNRQFAYKRKRRHCTACHHILRTKAMILKYP